MANNAKLCNWQVAPAKVGELIISRKTALYLIPLTALVALFTVRSSWKVEDSSNNQDSQISEKVKDPSSEPSRGRSQDPAQSSAPSNSYRSARLHEEGRDISWRVLKSLKDLPRKREAPPIDPEMGALIDEILYSSDSEAKTLAIRKLRASTVVPEARVAIFQALEDSDEGVRMEALSALPAFGDWTDLGVRSKLEDLARGDPSEVVRTRAGQLADALGSKAAESY